MGETTFTWEGEPCARLSIEQKGNEFFFYEEERDPSYGWLPTRIERFATLDEAERKYEDRCNWYDAVGCVEVINPALV